MSKPRNIIERLLEHARQKLSVSVFFSQLDVFQAVEQGAIERNASVVLISRLGDTPTTYSGAGVRQIRNIEFSVAIVTDMPGRSSTSLDVQEDTSLKHIDLCEQVAEIFEENILKQEAGSLIKTVRVGDMVDALDELGNHVATTIPLSVTITQDG